MGSIVSAADINAVARSRTIRAEHHDPGSEVARIGIALDRDDCLIMRSALGTNRNLDTAVGVDDYPHRTPHRVVYVRLSTSSMNPIRHILRHLVAKGSDTALMRPDPWDPARMVFFRAYVQFVGSLGCACCQKQGEIDRWC